MGWPKGKPRGPRKVRVQEQEPGMALVPGPIALTAQPALGNSVVLYEGPSLLDGAPIVAVLTGLVHGSRNAKTGTMLQTWILRADQSPSAAVDSGADASICGDCRHRGDGRFGRSCYVTWWQGPAQVYKALAKAPRVSLTKASALVAGQQVRLGAYGDPAAVPTAIWDAVVFLAAGWTGYTHQWRLADPWLKAFCMASVDTLAEEAEARGRGWRTFRVRPLEGEGAEVLEGEVVCPASAEAGHSTTCLACNLCRGASRPAKSVVIQVHGSRTRWFTQPRLAPPDGTQWISLTQRGWAPELDPPRAQPLLPIGAEQLALGVG